jgi:hypothetical protein
LKTVKVLASELVAISIFRSSGIRVRFDRWMLTRAKLKHGEGKLECFDPEIQRRIHKHEMDSPRKLGPFKSEDDFFEAFK